MCVRKKTVRSAKENLKTGSIASTPKSRTPGQKKVKEKAAGENKAEENKAEENKEESKNASKDVKEDSKEKDPNENIVARPLNKILTKDFLEEKKKEPLHIKVPPPRVMKAKRPMKEVRSARDPEYKTLELDISEWESVKIMKRSEINPDEIAKKDNKVDANTKT